MQALIKDILEFSKVTTDKNNFVDTDLNLLVADVVADMESMVGKKKQPFIYNRCRR
jgi:light-regulated signal transduction histidine kinase (bacteriophytochrome)